MNAAKAISPVLSVAAVALVIATLSACHPVRRSEPLVGPMTLTDPGLHRGRLLFDKWCYKCHAEGEGALGPAMNHLPLPKALMRLQVRVGLGAMPSFGKDQISDDELTDMLNYIVYLRHHYPRR